MKTILTILAFLVFSVAFAQKDSLSREASYALFAGLVATWETKGNWKNGSPYHQQMVVDKELTANIFKAKTQDFVDSRQFDDSRRNFGVRAWDKQEMKMKFWEFDVFGGITKARSSLKERTSILYTTTPTSKARPARWPMHGSLSTGIPISLQ